MCGIAGVLYSDPTRRPDPTALAAMSDAIAHRGPDAEGLWCEPGVGLVHRRLSIIDAAGGDQPIGNEDGSVQVVFNGEIYNFRELRAALESRGHRFQTNSDTEVLVHLYEDYGDRVCDRLRGMFAFALWDRRQRRLLLARDRIGIKPLYLYRDAEKLVFGSELKAILAYPDVPRDVDPAALEDYLAFGFVPGPRAILRRTEKLQPAHVLAVRADRLHAAAQRYWQLQFLPDHSPTEDDWKEAIRAKVRESVRLHLVADVVVGAFLSGGVDSSVVVATAADAVRQPLRTFSIGFDDPSFDETPFAREVARHLVTVHIEQVVRADAVSIIDELAWHFDEPFADPSAVPTFLLARLASGNVKAVLSGDGGDEAFGGYERYVHDLREAGVRRLFPAWLRRVVLRRVANAWPRGDWLPRPLRARTRLANVSLDAAAAYVNTLSVCRAPLRRQLLTADVVAALRGYEPGHPIRSAFAGPGLHDPLAGMIAADTATLLPDDFLVKVDRASMAHGLEVRPPLVDHELLELAARIPSEWKVRDGAGKWIFKRAFKDQLPPSIAPRRKRGFDLPIDAWFRGPLGELFQSAVLAPHARVQQFLNAEVAAKLYEAHRSGLGRHGHLLWSLLVLERWSEQHLVAPANLLAPPAQIRRLEMRPATPLSSGSVSRSA